MTAFHSRFIASSRAEATSAGEYPDWKSGWMRSNKAGAIAA
jgi:hypothetical protein